jgi:hypothetical protein
MNDKIVVRRLRGGSLFKLIFIGNFTFFLPFSLIAGILAMFGADSVTWNQQPVTGIPAFIVSLFGGLLTGLVLSALGWVAMFIGLWIYSRFKSIQLEYIPIVGGENQTPSDSPHEAE